MNTFSVTNMGCLKLTYHTTGGSLDVTAENFLRVIGKKGQAEKKCLDYYPFGSSLPGRNYNQNDYKYAFNGMEKDDEVNGSGNSYTTQFRQYDSRVGRWLSVDPKFSASETPYASMGNNPMMYNDILGDTVKYYNAETQKAVEDAMSIDSEFAKTVQILINSDVVYQYILTGTADYRAAASEGSVNPGGVTTDGEKINIGFQQIKNAITDGKNTSLYHETEHAVQFEHGEIGYRKNKNGVWTVDASYDINDEVKGFEAGMKAPGVDKVAKRGFEKKSSEGKMNYVGRKSEQYRVLRKQASVDKSNNMPVDKNHGATFDGKQRTVKTNTLFFKTHKKR